MNNTTENSTPQNKIPPLHARLFRYQLEASELHLLRTMVEFSRDGSGSLIWTSLETLSIYSKISAKQIKRLIRGWTNKRTGIHTPGLVERGILTELTPANAKGKKKPATFRINEAALTEDPDVIAYLEEREERRRTLPGIELPRRPDMAKPRQRTLPGVRRGRSATQKHLRWEENTLPMGDTVSINGGHRVPLQSLAMGDTVSTMGDTVSPDLLIDPRRGESVEAVDGFSGVGFDGSVFEIVKKREMSSSTAFPPELAEGLRELLPEIDNAAIRQIFQQCKANADDCTVEEILHFTRAKAPFLPKATNPAGFLIHAVPMCVTPDALIALRDRRQREETARREAEEERARNQAEMAAYCEAFRKTEELERRAAAELDGWPEQDQDALKHKVAAELFQQRPEARNWPGLKEQVRRLMIKRVAETLSQPANMV